MATLLWLSRSCKVYWNPFRLTASSCWESSSCRWWGPLSSAWGSCSSFPWYRPTPWPPPNLSGTCLSRRSGILWSWELSWAMRSACPWVWASWWGSTAWTPAPFPSATLSRTILSLFPPAEIWANFPAALPSADGIWSTKQTSPHISCPHLPTSPKAASLLFRRSLVSTICLAGATSLRQRCPWPEPSSSSKVMPIWAGYHPKPYSFFGWL